MISWCLRHQEVRTLLRWSSLESSLILWRYRYDEWRIQLDTHVITVDPRFTDVTDEVAWKTVPCFLGRRLQEHPPFGGHDHSGLHQERITTIDHDDGRETLRDLSVKCRFARRVRHVTLLIRTHATIRVTGMNHAWVRANGKELVETVKTVTLHEKTSVGAARTFIEEVVKHRWSSWHDYWRNQWHEK